MAWVVLAVCLMSPPQARPEAEVYAVLLKLRYQATPAFRLSVKDMTVPMPTLTGSSADWLREFKDVPRALRDAARQPTPTRAIPFDRSLLPRRTKWISEQEIERTLRGTPNNWPRFKPRYGTDGWLSLSEVLFTAERLDALVYYDARYGGHGDSGYVWLHRETTQSRWAVAKRIISAMA